MDRDLIKDVLISQNRPRQEKIVERTLMGNIIELKNTPFVIIISGIRRCGKSTLLRSLIDQDCYYVNFDDDRFVGVTLEDLTQVQNLLIELFGERNTYLLDEVQNISGWERFVRRLHDEGKKVFVTGSNATMLSRELGTHLTGRNITLTLYPFSFREYLSYKSHDIIPFNQMTSTEKSLVRKAFSEYLIEGGFPEYLMTGKDEYLRTLFQNILFRDIITRYHLPLETPIREAGLYAASNISKEMSFNAVKNLTGLSSATTIKEYFEYMENSYLLFLISRYDHSLKKQIFYNKKVYFIDLALAKLVGFRPSEDHGRMLENIVFLALKSSGDEIYFHKGSRECDFLLRKDGRITGAIQVTRNLERSKSREIEGLLEALNAHGLDEGLVLTNDEDGEMEVEGKRIIIKPVWQWLLENQ